MKIVVLGGGLSPERDVSKKSASLIANALLNRGHEVSLVDLYEGSEASDPQMMTTESARKPARTRRTSSFFWLMFMVPM